MIAEDDPRMDEWRDDAKREEEWDRFGFDDDLICGGCGARIIVRFDERTDEPFHSLEACEECGAEDWNDA